MTGVGNHIINRVVYHVHGVPVSKAFSIKEEAAAYIKGGFSNHLQMLFDKYFPGEDNIYIDKLQLNLTLMPGEIDLNKYGKQLLELLEKQLQKKAAFNQPQKIIKREEFDEQKLKGVIQNAAKENYTPPDAFIFFLEKGYLPWWYKITKQEEFEQQLVTYFTAANEDTMRLTAGKIVNVIHKIIYRFIHQFSDDFKFKLAAFFIGEHSAEIKKLYIKLMQAAKEKLTLPFKTQRKISGTKAQTRTRQSIETGAAFLFWNMFWHLVETGNSFKQFEKELEKTAEKILASSNKPAVKDTMLQKLIEESKEQQWQPEKNDVSHVEKKETHAADQIFINNAGLVLLHPFLTTLFNALLVAKDDHVIDCAKALACLNYLCGYKEMQPEFEWPLMKILCGMEISETVEQLFELSDADKLECNALLQQVIDYWIALKQTSAEGLQQTFIQRFGKLTANENGWLLQVEQKTVDILKDRLPWGVSMCKLPWMQELLTVEW